jgi:hypothetical protein
VEPGKAPMTVSPLSGTATNLSADKLDGQNSTAFLKSRIYTIGGETEQFGVLLPDGTRRLEAHCKQGDLPLGGGPANINPDTRVLNSFPELRFSPPGWVVTIKNSNDEFLADKWSVVVLCADQ